LGEVGADVGRRVVPDRPAPRQTGLVAQPGEFPAGRLAVVLDMQLDRGPLSCGKRHDLEEEVVGGRPSLLVDRVVGPANLSEADCFAGLDMLESEAYGSRWSSVDLSMPRGSI